MEIMKAFLSKHASRIIKGKKYIMQLSTDKTCILEQIIELTSTKN